MNEDQARELFAPTRERVMPPAAFSMTAVYAADARRRRQRRSAAVAATVGVVVAIVGAFAVSGGGGSRGIRPVASPSTRPPTLAALLDQLQLPPDARPAPGLGDLHSAYEGEPGAQQQARSWTTGLAPAAAVLAMTAHPLAGVASHATGQGTKGELAYVTAAWTTPETATIYGPEVEVEALQRAGGGSTISALAWQLVKPAKSAADFVPTDVDSVVGTVADVGGGNARRATASGDQARRLAADINALWVDVAPASAGCGVGPYATGITLDFHSSAGESSFGDICGVVAPVRNKAGVPSLVPTAALERDLALAFADIMSASSTSPPPGSANLVSLLNQVPVPSGAHQVSTPADGEAADAGYSRQPGYAQAVRYWTTTMSPAATIAAMTARPPAGMTGAVTPPMPNKGHPDAQAHYRVADTAGRIGPRLDLYAIALGDGRTAVSALAWQIDEAAKPTTDRVTGTVASVTATYTDPAGTPQTGTVTGAPAQQLAADFNALLVNVPADPTPCPATAPALTLVFHSSTGDTSAKDSCGRMTTLFGTGRAPDLDTSDALNLDVNRDFASLMPEALPSSAPLPTVGASAILVVGITVVGGPPGAPTDVNVAGDISLVHDGVRAGGGAVTQGHTLALHVAPGSYDVSATWSGMHCAAPPATAGVNHTTTVQVICNIK